MRCSLKAGSAVIKLFLFVRQDILCWCIFSFQVVETGFPVCYWDSDLRSPETVYTVHRKCCFLSVWSLQAGRRDFWNIQGISTEENILPFLLKWIFSSPGVLCFGLWYVFRRPRHVQRNLHFCIFSYNFKTISRQSRYLDLIVIGPVSCWCLWTYHASSCSSLWRTRKLAWEASWTLICNILSYGTLWNKPQSYCWQFRWELLEGSKEPLWLHFTSAKVL